MLQFLVTSCLDRNVNLRIIDVSIKPAVQRTQL